MPPAWTVCKPIGVDVKTRRAFCIHGPMAKNGTRNNKQDWRCCDKKERQHRYMSKFIVVTVAGMTWRYRVTPELKQGLQERLYNFRTEQMKEYSEVNKVWLDQQDSHAK